MNLSKNKKVNPLGEVFKVSLPLYSSTEIDSQYDGDDEITLTKKGLKKLYSQLNDICKEISLILKNEK